MLLGAIMLACATGTTINGWVIMYAVSQLVYGVGVGGELLVCRHGKLCLTVTALHHAVVVVCSHAACLGVLLCRVRQ